MRELRSNDQADDLLDVLRTGCFATTGPDGTERARPSEEVLRTAWEYHGAAILDDFVRANPGRRPWGWWRFGPGRELLPREWPLHVIARVRSRDRFKPSEFESRAILTMAGLLDETEV